MSEGVNGIKLWGGGIGVPVNEGLRHLNDSLTVDQRMWHEDLDGSRAYAEALCDVGILTGDELHVIKEGLTKVEHRWKTNGITFLATDEDVHTVNERLLTELIGDVGGKLHTGRSRNDQVALDVKLWMRKAVNVVMSTLLRTIECLLRVAERDIDVLMPGYTHLQRAQVVRFSHWILSHATFFKVFIVQSTLKTLGKVRA